MDDWKFYALMLLIGLAIFFGFVLLDEWHKRYAWRRANREAERIMRAEYDRLQRLRNRPPPPPAPRPKLRPVPHCTYCGSAVFIDGPRGGKSTNILCANNNCRHWFNYTPLPDGKFVLDDLHKAEPRHLHPAVQKRQREDERRDREQKQRREDDTTGSIITPTTIAAGAAAATGAIVAGGGSFGGAGAQAAWEDNSGKIEPSGGGVAQLATSAGIADIGSAASVSSTSDSGSSSSSGGDSGGGGGGGGGD